MRAYRKESDNWFPFCEFFVPDRYVPSKNKKMLSLVRFSRVVPNLINERKSKAFVQLIAFKEHYSKWPIDTKLYNKTIRPKVSKKVPFFPSSYCYRSPRLTYPQFQVPGSKFDRSKNICPNFDERSYQLSSYFVNNITLYTVSYIWELYNKFNSQWKWYNWKIRKTRASKAQKTILKVYFSGWNSQKRSHLPSSSINTPLVCASR